MTASIPKRIIGKTTLPLPEKILISKGCVKTSTRNLKKGIRDYTLNPAEAAKVAVDRIEEGANPDVVFLTSQEL